VKLVFSGICCFLTLHWKKRIINQRGVAVRPDLGEVEGIERAGGCLRFGHHLEGHGPAGEIAFVDTLQEIALMAFPVPGDDGLRFLVGQVLDALLRFKISLSFF
jgi:hypothetical protein